jgi:uncharacterized RDD family membrane protein YckC
MVCPNCNAETDNAFFCRACDVFMADPSAGAKAGVARRLAAQFLDGICIWAAFFAVMLLGGIVGGLGGGADRPAVVLGLSFGTFLSAVVGYIIFSLWFLAQGKTPGKWLVGIRAVDKSNGGSPGLGRMLVRETVGKFASGLFLGLGYFWAIWDRDTQAWHDKIAGTLVLRNKVVPAVDTQQLALAPQSFAGVTSLVPRLNQLSAIGSAVADINTSTFCENCGAKVVNESAYCEECGVRIAS